MVAGGSAFIVGAIYLAMARLVLRRHWTIGALSASYVNSANLGIPIAIFVLGGLAGLVLSLIGVRVPDALMDRSTCSQRLGTRRPTDLRAIADRVPNTAKGSSPRRDVALATVLKMVVQSVLVYPTRYQRRWPGTRHG